MLLAYLLIQRAVRELTFRRRHRLVARYQPFVDAITQFGAAPETLDLLRGVPAFHRRIVAGLLLAPLHVARGSLVSHVREAAIAIGLVEQWLADLRSRRWWLRADGVRALGFVAHLPALPAILRALNDEHQEVRAAAAEAAGRLGNPRAIPLLLAQLDNGSRYQRARVVDALQQLGPRVTPALADFVEAHPQHAALAAEVLELIGTAAAMDPLLQWCDDARGDVRAAALRALGSIGLDDRGYDVALQALDDADPGVRAMAARALGRGRRDAAVRALAGQLDDEWLPAAQAAGALRLLGAAGRAALQARAGDTGQAGDLARQMLWSAAPITAHA